MINTIDKRALLSLKRKVLSSESYYSKKGVKTRWHLELICCIDSLINNMDNLIYGISCGSEKNRILCSDVLLGMHEYAKGRMTLHEVYWRCSMSAKALYSNGREEM